MTHKKLANIIGTVSVVCSLAFWMWAAIFLFTPFGHHSEWVLRVMVNFQLWSFLWALALVLAIVAGRLGHWLWILAAILPLASAVTVWHVMATTEW